LNLEPKFFGVVDGREAFEMETAKPGGWRRPKRI